MLANKPEVVLFDLDGTLVNTMPDLANCIDLMMTEFGLPACGEEKVRDWIGNGVEHLVKSALIDGTNQEPDQDLFNKALPMFLDFYEQYTCIHSQCYPG